MLRRKFCRDNRLQDIASTHLASVRSIRLKSMPADSAIENVTTVVEYLKSIQKASKAVSRARQCARSYLTLPPSGVRSRSSPDDTLARGWRREGRCRKQIFHNLQKLKTTCLAPFSARHAVDTSAVISMATAMNSTALSRCALIVRASKINLHAPTHRQRYVRARVDGLSFFLQRHHVNTDG